MGHSCWVHIYCTAPFIYPFTMVSRHKILPSESLICFNRTKLFFIFFIITPLQGISTPWIVCSIVRGYWTIPCFTHFTTLISFSLADCLKKRIKIGLKDWSGFGMGINFQCTLSISNSPSVSISRLSFRIFWTQLNRVPLVPPASRYFICSGFRKFVFGSTEHPLVYFWHYFRHTVAFNSAMVCLIVETSLYLVWS